MARMPTQYDNFDFPEYEFREFPKYVQPADGGKPIIAHNKREEQELLAEGAKDFQSSGKPDTEKDEKTDLLERAEKLGIDVVPQWGIARLRSTVEEAELKAKNKA